MQFKRFILLGLMSCAGLVACQANGTGAAKSSLHIEKVEVYRSDNSTQCGGAGVAPETMQRELGDIQVFVARKDYLRGVAWRFRLCAVARLEMLMCTRLLNKTKPLRRSWGFACLVQ